jgi:hypothetical protein
MGPAPESHFRTKNACKKDAARTAKAAGGTMILVAGGGIRPHV